MADNDTSQTVQENVRTGTDNRVRLAPFTVTLNCPERWDPSAGPLELEYDVRDRNARVRRGRLRYVVFVDGTETTLYTMNLDSTRLRPGCYELVQNQRWDGIIQSGIEDRIRQRITADLSLLYVYVEVWNTDNAEPGQEQGEWDAMAVRNVEIDAIAEASWDRDWVIPDKNPDEPDKGRVSMTINVKNVAEGTPVMLEIMRIGEIDDPDSDFPYVDNSEIYADDQQPGMAGAVVRNNQVMMGEGNSKPEVIFNQFDEHWIHPGNNFYVLKVGFGVDGVPMQATERDYESNEDKCLHMRFTVFIHDAASNLPGSRRASRQLRHFFGSNTKYWRPYHMVNGPNSVEDWLDHYHRQFVVIFSGHSGCACKSHDHPTYSRGSGRNQREVRKRLPGSRFRVDQNACPADIDRPRVGGCGEKGGVMHQLILGRLPNQASLGSWRNKKLVLMNRYYQTETNKLYMVVSNDDFEPFFTTQYEPRFLFYADGCRTILTTNMGENFTDNETKFFHGWIYSVDDDVAAGLMIDLFKKWIKGTRADPAPNEFDAGRFIDVYRRETVRTRGRRRYHARVMDSTGVLNPSNRASPTATAEAIE